MPEITETTPTTEITIAGKSFKAPQPYASGHVLNANEASALNQTYAENLRNNFASKVKEADEAGTFDADVFQSRFDEYASEYEFGVRTGGGRSGDPIQTEAMSIARDLVRKALSKKPDVKLSDVPASKISELAKGVLAKGDERAQKIMDTARARVEAAKELDVDVDTDSLGGDEEAAPTKRGKKQPEAVEA